MGVLSEGLVVWLVVLLLLILIITIACMRCCTFLQAQITGKMMILKDLVLDGSQNFTTAKTAQFMDGFNEGKSKTISF